MNTRNRIVLASAVAFGLVAGAFASSQVVPVQATAVVHAMPESTLPTVVVIGHREPAQIATLETITIIGHAQHLAKSDARARLA